MFFSVQACIFFQSQISHIVHCISIVQKLECLVRIPDLKRQFSLISPSNRSRAQTSLLYFSFDVYTLLWSIYYSHIRKEKWFPKVAGPFSDNFLFKELWMDLASLELDFSFFFEGLYSASKQSIYVKREE